MDFNWIGFLIALGIIYLIMFIIWKARKEAQKLKQKKK